MLNLSPDSAYYLKIKHLLLVGLLVLWCGVSWGQTTYTWVGPNNGSWITAGNWSPTRNSPATTDRLVFNSGSALMVTGVPSQTIGSLSVGNNTRITLQKTNNISNLTLTINNGTGDDLTVSLGSSLTVLTPSISGRLRIALGTNATGRIDGELILGNIGDLNTSNSGVLITVAGKITNTGGSFSNTASDKMIFAAGSEYHHARNGSTLPLATWASTSILRITGTTTTTTGNTNQNFGEVILASPGYNVNMAFSPISVAGNLTIQNQNNTNQIRIGSSFTISGNLNLVSGQLAFQSGNASQTVTVNGNVSISGGTVNLSRVTTYTGTLIINGNYNQTGGSVTETNTSGTIVFQGGGSVQTFSKTGGTFSQTVNFEVTANSFLQFADANSTTSGSIGTFIMGVGSTLGIRSPDGISTTGSTGHIQNSGTRTFSTSGNYIYNGSANQTVGTGPPSTINSLTIANTGAEGSNTVTLNASRTITSDLSVLSGTFNMSTFTANRGASGGTLTLAANTNLLVGGTNNFPANYSSNTLNCTSTVNYNALGAQTIGGVNYGNLILSGSGTKTFQTGTTQICNNFTLSGTVTSTAVTGLTIGGNVDIGTGTTFSAATFTHNVGGNWTRAGTFNQATSTINFIGANPGTVQSTTFNNLTFSGAGSKTASGNLTINGNVLISNNFNANNFLHTVAGNWTNNSTFTPSTSTISFTGSASQTISGSSASPFQALTINNSAGVSVSSPVSVSTTLTLSAGNFVTNGNLTMGDESSILLTIPTATMTGAIQGTGEYDVTYQGGSRNSGSELSGAELRNVTLTSTSGSTLTATVDFTMKGQLNIPTGVTLQMGTFSIGPSLITTIGGGQLLTQSISLEPLPADVTWSFPVRFNRSNGGQTVPFGSFDILEILSSSGNTSLAVEELGDIVIRNQLNVTTPSTVDASSSRVIFNANAAQSIPGLAFRKLTLSGSGNKTLAVGTSIEREFVINSSALALLGGTNRSVETLILNGVSQAVGSYGSTASSATNRPAAFFGTSGTGILYVTSVCLDGKWEGSVSTDWFNPANWCSGSVPLASTDVTIPATVTLPLINTTAAVARTITIESGASLTMTGASGLSVRGNWINNGTFTAGSGTVSFQGATAQTTSGSSATNFRNLVIANTSTGVTLGSATSVGGILTLTQGVLAAGTNLSMSASSEIIRNAGSLTGTLQGTNAFDVSYTGNTKTSGPELTNTGLRNLTVNLTSGQTLTLGTTPALPDGNLSLTGGRLATGTNSIDRSAAGGTLTIGPGTTFITTRGGADAFPITYSTRVIDASSTVEYLGTNQTVAANTYGNVILGGASGLKTFAGATTIAGNLSILATTSANLGSANSSANTLTLGGTGQPNGSYGSTASTALYKNSTFFGTTATGILNVTTSTLVCVSGYWIGGTSTDWFTTSNWCGGVLPTTTTDLLIPAVAPFKPVINTAGAVARNITIETGASLEITGTQIFTLNGNWTNNGTFTPGTGTIAFSGTTAQTISGAGTNTFNNLSLNNSTGLTLSSAASVAGTLTLSSGTLASGTNLTLNVNSEIIRSNGAMTGTIQGSNSYNLTYQGTNKTTGAEVSGSGLNNVTVTLTAGQTLTSGSAFTAGGVLTIPTNVTLNMVGFQLSGNTLTSSGAGTLSTQNTSPTPLPLSRSWSFSVLYNNLTGGQRVVSGVYQNLGVQLNSGTTTLGPDSDGPIEIASGNFTRLGTGGTLAPGTSLVIFSGPSAQNIPAINFNDLELKGGGDKVFTGSGNIGGNLSISGTAIARLGANNRTANSLTLSGIGQPAGIFGSTASTAAFKRAAFFGTVDTGLLTVSVSTAVCDAEIFTWTGGTSTNWFTASNWCNNAVPTLATDVFISSTAPNQPVIGANGAFAQNLTIESGATLTISGAFAFTVGGNWENNGTFVSGTTSTVVFGGTEDGVISGGNFANVSFTGAGVKSTSGDLTISGNILISDNFDAGDGLHTVGGNWITNGDFTSGSGTITFNGTTAQTISGSLPSDFNNLTLNNSAGLTLSSTGSIGGTLRLSSGTLAAGTNLSIGDNAEIIRNGGAMTGTIQGSNAYTITYLGASKTTGAEVSGSGLNNVTVTLNASQILSAGSNFTVGGNLDIPTNVSLNMVGFQLLGNNLTTSGSGTLRTQSTTSTPLPLNRSWSFLVLYDNLTGGQKVVSGVYQNLSVQFNSGTTTLGPESEGPIEIASGDFTRTGSGGTISAGTSLVSFSGPSAQNIPAIALNNLELKGGGDKVFTGSQNIGGNLSISGSAIARLGSSTRSANTLTLGGTGQPIGSFGSTASSAAFKNATYFGTTDTGILNVSSSTLICTNGTWIGGTSTDWFTAANWCGGIPTASTDVLIESTAPFQPVIAAIGAVVGNISVQTGASLVISGTFTLSVHGDWTNSGTFTSGSNSTVDFTGTPAASIGSGSFANVSFTGTGTKTLNSTIIVAENISPISTPVILSGTNTLTLNPGKTMQITSSGSVTTGSGRVILLPAAIFVNESTSNPTLEVRQTLTGNKGWRMIGTPVTTAYATLTSGLETQGFPGSTNPSLQPNLLWWDETDKGTTLQGWRQPSNLSAAAPAGRGHYFYIFNGATKPGGGNYTDNLPKTISVTGTEVNLASGIFDFGVTFTARDNNLVAQADTLIEVNQADEGFNMLANPTASTIDFHSGSGWTKTNIDQTTYVWDPVSNAFRTWNGTTGDLGSGRIAPYQAFWVKANAVSPSLQLSGNGSKTLTSTSFFGRKLDTTPPTLELNVAGEGMQANSFITFGADGKLGADPKDAYQLESLAEDWLLLYSFGSPNTRSPLVINHQPDAGTEDRVIPLHLAASKKGKQIHGTYLMDWKIPAEWPANTEIVLMDHINQKAIDMRQESMHTFSFEAPKAPVSNARKTWDGFQVPRAVVFQTPYEFGEDEELSMSNMRLSRTASSKPTRPFTIFIGAFPNDRIEYLPDFPRLFAPVPNPFSSNTKIRFYLPVAEKVEINIFDLLGNAVGNFPAQDYGAGIRELEWIPSSINLPSGMYVIRLSTTTGQFTQKLIKN
jgi:hypothetical protein